MFIPDPDFYPSRIPYLGSQIQKRQQKRRGKNVLSFLFFSQKYHKIETYFTFEQVKKKILAN